MIYTKLTKKAMCLCVEKHKEQVDKSGMPYLLHPLQVAESMPDEASVCVALLHDIIEDTDVTAEQLIELGFYPYIVEAICLLTHDRSVPYFEYIAKIKNNALASVVKAADLQHNMDLSRLDTVTESDLQRAEKYKKAYEMLCD